MISVVIPVYNEENTLEGLTQRLIKVLSNLDEEYEIIFINDGSEDKSGYVIRELNNKYSGIIKAVHFNRNFGKSHALKEGFNRAKGDIVYMIDADLQDLPEEIPKLLKEMKDKDLDAVSGWKESRQDSFSKRFLSKIFNYVMQKYSGVKIHDFNCGLKVFRKEAINNLILYGQMHRFILLLITEKGFKVGEVKVAHQKRQFGESKYGIERIYQGLLDFISIIFLTRFIHSPLHFFGVMAVFCFALAFILMLYFGGLQLYSILWSMPYYNIGNYSLLVLILLFFLLTGLIFACFGLLGALIVHLIHDERMRPSNKQPSNN